MSISVRADPPVPNTPGSFSGYANLLRIGMHRWCLATPLIYHARHGAIITVPAGFVTDGASIPRVLWWLYPPLGGNYTEGALVHDYCYAHAEQVRIGPRALQRDEADYLLRECCRVMDCCRDQEDILYAGVRMGGWWSWQRYRQAAKRVTLVDGGNNTNA